MRKMRILFLILKGKDKILRKRKIEDRNVIKIKTRRHLREIIRIKMQNDKNLIYFHNFRGKICM